MAIQTEQLVTRPFSEIIERGNEAIAQAEDVADEDEDVSWRMLKAGQALVKEGERAMKRLAPMVKDQTPEFGDALKDLMTRDGEVKEKQRALDGMLYDFEDYIEVDSFDEAKFKELQAAAKSLALTIMEAVRGMVIEPTKELPRPTVFPPLPPLPRTARTGSQSSKTSTHPVRPATSVPSKESQQHSLWPNKQSSTKGTRVRSGSTGASNAPIPSSPEAWPRPPTSPQAAPSPQADRDSGRFDFGVDPRTTQWAQQPLAPPPVPRSVPSQPMPHAIPPQHFGHAIVLPNRAQASPSPTLSSRASPPQVLPLQSIPSGPDYLRAEMERIRLAAEPMSPVERRLGVHLAHLSSSPEPLAASLASAWATTMVTTGQHRTPIDTRDARVPSLSERENKSILIEEWASSDRSTIPDTTSTIGNPSWKVVDLVIGPDSSFYERKGFCKGAKTFRESGPGDAVKKVGGAGDVPKPTPYTQDILYGHMFSAPPPVFADAKAQCMHCEYEHKYSQLLQDTDKESIADLQGEGIRYRRRFLYKSHMATRHMTKTSYGCPFCVHIGSTTYEGDATVFPSAALLLRHLARHPQPLPDVPGLTVLYGTITGEPNEHDFDIHFPNPAAPPGGPPDGGASLPSAVATRDHVQMPDEKPLARPEPGTEVLQFFAGARIIGVEFPERWGGKWCLGWHDGMFGAFQARWVQLEAPRRGKLAGQAPPRTQRSGVARWKWDVKAGNGPGWLGFDKGETITNLDWDDPDAWYWVGTTSKGKHGIFPTSHMKIETIKDGSLEGLTSPVKPKKRGFFGLGRRNSSAAPSEHGSGHSHKS
ncbi:conserved hypothetical protein [Verticillium alfalfae VaMs.102]|uniref:SH3 domain-containing protein n=1 Tax=Verticillium alfalfae (strain VaMs.102 / ATCC MYA-4576 / FGSC 10136) TaxID=526221 RepID=C9SWX8_VERA1|nr:conserved hypothetical protein [Verticillium alfalfae VaMs.102]EEY23519.1 conserved hypothetical protein [Verticillium alfalfae VaMs.102]